MRLELEEASPADLAEVAALMNRAYRGGEGWASEAGYIAGDRTRPELIAEEARATPDARLLVIRSDGGSILGCVRLEPAERGVWYLGSLTIDPDVQNAGAGRRLLKAAEGWVAARGGRTVRMTVVHLRASLIAWYERRGYRVTGETRPWPYHDTRFGVPLRDDLVFVVLEKRLAS